MFIVNPVCGCVCNYLVIDCFEDNNFDCIFLGRTDGIKAIDRICYSASVTLHPMFFLNFYPEKKKKKKSCVVDLGWFSHPLILELLTKMCIVCELIHGDNA